MNTFFSLSIAVLAIFAIFHVSGIAASPLLGGGVDQDLSDTTKVDGIGNSVTELIDADVAANVPVTVGKGGDSLGGLGGLGGLNGLGGLSNLLGVLSLLDILG